MDNETANGDAAVKATAHVIMAFGGKPAYTQFTSSNGGQITTGDYSYQIAQQDPYDGLITSLFLFGLSGGTNPYQRRH